MKKNLEIETLDESYSSKGRLGQGLAGLLTPPHAPNYKQSDKKSFIGNHMRSLKNIRTPRLRNDDMTIAFANYQNAPSSNVNNVLKSRPLKFRKLHEPMPEHL